ncbi:hypothetical protein BCV70DRAFT_21785 [Testicularia cyperi]|uniref:Uncharacterized protein n=1 Tax=Testicularia cyperi TaxID=1882483 RepID=A0A317XZF6_9BASI|nr:hypothetical protein BCV70DRAFT_21785 [Testicularia cyperi]
MTRAEAAPRSVAEPQKDRHSQGLPGSSAGPNKAGATAPSGAGALGSEIGAERDARRELQQAVREGDDIPPPNTNAASHSLGFGQLNGFDQGLNTPGEEARDKMQEIRNSEIDKDQPDLRTLARNSAGSASHHQVNQSAYQSTGASDPSNILESVSRSQGTESGTGSAGIQGGASNVEVGRDAPTNFV